MVQYAYNESLLLFFWSLLAYQSLQVARPICKDIRVYIAIIGIAN